MPTYILSNREHNHPTIAEIERGSIVTRHISFLRVIQMENALQVISLILILALKSSIWFVFKILAKDALYLP